ncbi:aldehyde dehydrogenase family protein [Verticiella sediminum]|uniref:Aldehyde dehydrogenase family protein n=1 Tax=Verticiella sediminum TaxID=1247510 RepID=A0A556AYE3_9BURK|nr:aldehyde dehydrogenase family protein [Verticiella sediminum]TSH97951.1 aldehyde dehydrogenase family protein [Verticiella sediminum]
MPYDNLIAGAWHAGSSYGENRNPSDPDDVIGLYAQADATQLDVAAQAAQAAFATWSTAGIQARSDALERIGVEILARKDELAELLAREEGKTRPEALGEVMRAGSIFKFFAGECLRLSGEILPSVRPGVAVEITREPVGVIGIITPWNFPIAIPAWKIAPALAYGNCVVFKPADLVPGTAWILAEIIHRSGIPEGVFNLVMGRGSVIGEPLVNHPAIAAVSFTGSVEVGSRIAAQCAQSGKKVQLEMGGKNPQVVLDDADLDQAVELCAQSAFFSTGQRCTASSRLIVTEGIHERFIAALAARMARLQVGDALAVGTDIGPAVSQAQMSQDLRHIDIALTEGATIAAGGTPVQCHTGSGKAGYFVAPTLLAGTSPAMRINREEVFGPVASVIRVRDYDEALAVANDTQFGLSAGIATTSLKHATHFKRHAQAGMVMVNLPTAGVDYHVPFGGRKASSYGPREQGRYAQEFFTTVKTAYTLA